MLRQSPRGFTLIELIIVVAIIAIIAISIFVAVNPAKRIGQSRDAQRWSDITAIAGAIEKYTADNGALPSDFSSSTIAIGDKIVLCNSASSLTCDGTTDSCLVIDDADFLNIYLPEIPYDPAKSSASDTGYYITRTTGDRLTLGCCGAYDSN